MKLRQLSPQEAVGHLAVHSLKTPEGKLGKGQVITVADAETLVRAGIESLSCAVADPGDVDENAAAERLAKALGGAGVIPGNAFTGRINFTAEDIGIVRYNREALKRVNAVDEGITLALVQHNQLLAPGDMIATLKIIPFFVAAENLARVEAILTEAPLFTFHPLRPSRTSPSATPAGSV